MRKPPVASRLLVANRGEIAIRIFRSASELGLRTIALYSHEDRFALHRFKADEAYPVGRAGEPIRAYLDIPAVVALARDHGVDAVHPGYGFLSENPAFASALLEAGIAFVGPRPEILTQLGDKTIARRLAASAGVPVLPGCEEPLTDNAQAHELARAMGYPVIVKAAHGGGGRGMRVALTADKLDEALDQARRESGAAFGSAAVFLEKFVPRARHIEVQLLGDRHGNLVHLYERDCSVQRRHQKIVELAPAPALLLTQLAGPGVRQRILDAALAVGRAVRLDNAATAEFLVDADTGAFYFIEVNPRVQVEHTVTEQVTGHDIVRAQLLIAQGRRLDDPELALGDQAQIRTNGFAIQCRITTEDPASNFLPDYGRLSNYRSPGGMGIRLDGSAFTGAVITPFYDSLLVKVTAYGRTFPDAARHMDRALHEFRIRGVKTNIPFLVNVVNHPDFLAGLVTTRFIDQTPVLFEMPARQDRATKLLTYIAEVVVNGPLEPAARLAAGRTTPRLAAPLPDVPPGPLPLGTRDIFKELGPEKFAGWVRDQKRLLVTDTTFRDAHQSLLATRLRTHDMLRIAPYYAARLAGLFSLEMWGGATFDTSLRFLRESPWQRLTEMRHRVPNILFQMLLRSASAVGYTNYPDNVVHAFVRESAQAGIDLFRVFDALNYLPNLTLAIEAVRNAGMLCEAAVCYTGDVLDPARTKYDLHYFVSLAKELERRGATMLAIKDMAGLCKPAAARKLVKALRQEVGLPLHFHTHDCAGGQVASYLLAADEGVDVVDGAMAPLAGLTSQPSLQAIVEALRFQERDTGLEAAALQGAADYWQEVRRFYAAFETGQLAPQSDVYRNEMPGGQYTNLYQQAQALGLERRWPEVCQTYAEVNRLFGDIIKVTPTSKVVGDMCLFMVGNNLTPADISEGTRELAYPESVVEFFEGRLGPPPGGFPEALQRRVLRGRTPAVTGRPGATLPPADFLATRRELEQRFGRPCTDRDVVTHLLYPRVFPDFVAHQSRYSDTSVLPTPVFFHGLLPGEEMSIDIERGKTLIVKLLTVGDPHADGTRTVFFELNGQPREAVVQDRSLGDKTGAARRKAEPGNPLQIGSPMPGALVRVAVVADDPVVPGQALFTLEAMKMETTIYADRAGVVAEVPVQRGTQVATGDLLLRYQG